MLALRVLTCLLKKVYMPAGFACRGGVPKVAEVAKGSRSFVSPTLMHNRENREIIGNHTQ